MVNRHVWLDIEQNIIFGQQSIWPIRWNLNPVWPVKSRQMSIKVAQKWFHNKNEIFGHLYQNWLKCGRFGLNNCCHRLKKLPRVPKIAQYCHTAWIQHLFFFQNEIASTLNESFECCIVELGPYAETAREFSDLPESESSSMHAETDVESLQTRLSTLTEKQTLAKGIKDVQNISIFRADFRPLKRIVLPNISKVMKITFSRWSR